MSNSLIIVNGFKLNKFEQNEFWMLYEIWESWFIWDFGHTYGEGKFTIDKNNIDVNYDKYIRKPNRRTNRVA